MRSPHFEIYTLIALAATAAASGPTPIYINQVPEYALLSSCAEYEVSTIVRDMSRGCGDGSRTTSYACFCFQSSVKYSSMIGVSVSSACSRDTKQNTSAIDVFSRYCQIGVLGTPTDSSSIEVTTTSSFQTSSTPATGPATVFVTTTPTSSPSDPPPNTSRTKTTAIAAGVTVPVVLLVAGFAGFLLYRRRKKRQEEAVEPTPVGHPHGDYGKPEVYQLHADQVPVEIGDNARIAELDTPTKEEHRSTQQLDAPPSTPRGT